MEVKKKEEEKKEEKLAKIIINIEVLFIIVYGATLIYLLYSDIFLFIIFLMPYLIIRFIRWIKKPITWKTTITMEEDKDE